MTIPHVDKVRVEELTRAYQIGFERAIEQTTPGATFMGALPAAAAYGYTIRSAERSMFVTGFLDYIDSIDGSITTNGEGVVLKISPGSGKS